MKLGRPPNNERREEMPTVAFRLDPESKAAFEFLMGTWKRPPGFVGSARSDVLRAALVTAARSSGWRKTVR